MHTPSRAIAVRCVGERLPAALGRLLHSHSRTTTVCLVTNPKRDANERFRKLSAGYYIRTKQLVDRLLKMGESARLRSHQSVIPAAF